MREGGPENEEIQVPRGYGVNMFFFYGRFRRNIFKEIREVREIKEAKEIEIKEIKEVKDCNFTQLERGVPGMDPIYFVISYIFIHVYIR